MALRATDRQAKHIRTDVAHKSLQQRVTDVGRIDFRYIGVVGSRAQETRGLECIRDLRRELPDGTPVDEFIARELFRQNRS